MHKLGLHFCQSAYISRSWPREIPVNLLLLGWPKPLSLAMMCRKITQTGLRQGQLGSCNPRSVLAEMSCKLRRVLVNATLVVLCAGCCTSQPVQGQAHQRRSRLHTQSPRSEHASLSHTLQFELCNGFANQRIALASGIVIAHLLGRSAILPDAVANGTQATNDWRYGSNADLVPLSDMYDTEYLLASLQQAGIAAIESDQAPPQPPHVVKLSDAPDGDPVAWLETLSEQPHLRIDCPLLQLPPTDVAAHAPYFWAVLEALRPNQVLSSLVHRALNQLQTIGDEHTFTFLHLRIEDDWLGHCYRWSHYPDGIVRDNCFNNTFSLAEQFEGKGISKDSPLYIASSWKEASTQIVRKVLANLISGGYQVVTQAYLYPHKDEFASHGVYGREQIACVDYYIALEADKFIGNSVSSFSAMLLLERQRRDAWHSYYNNGNVPLSMMVPLFNLPWVFTYNSWSAEYDYMLKAAVRSGMHHGRLKPYCLFAGDSSAPIATWLEAHGVTMVDAEPKWVDRLKAVLRASNDSNIAHSHLYASLEMTVGSWQRVDIPVLPELSQYEYVVFTDADVYFRRPLTLDAFPLPLPQTVGMASEAVAMFPYNAGIMLMHLPVLRETYDDFIDFSFNNTHGLFYPGYGPGDQGAYNQFYEISVKEALLTQQFNAKPYHAYSTAAYIVHFHGPKPHEYLTYLRNGTCTFGSMCKDGIDNSFCDYALEWAHFDQDEEVGQHVLSMCDTVVKERGTETAPTLSALAIADQR